MTMATGPKFACLLLMCMVVIMSAPIAQAIVSCGQVETNLISCISYLRNGPFNPGCCTGIRMLNAAASTTADRRATCTCLKEAATAIPGINMGLAGSLPEKCGVNIPYKISTSINCASIS